MSQNIYPDNIEIVIEKNGKPVDSLPQEVKDSIEFLYEKGHDPDKEIKMHNSCLPIQGELIPIVCDYDDIDGKGIEQQLRNIISSLQNEHPSNRKFLMDFKDIRYLGVAEKVLTEMRPVLTMSGITFAITPRMQEAIKRARQVLKRGFAGRTKVAVEEV
jgi:hypothetical protein